MPKEKNNKFLLTGTITYMIGSFGTKFLSFLIVPLYTYYIEPSEFGEYDLLVTTVSLISPLLTMKISEATYRWIIRDKENEKTYISATYKLLLQNCLIFTIIILCINYFFPIWNCYYFLAILVGDRVLECLQKLLRGLKNQKLFAISGLLHTVIMLGSNLIKICIFKEGVVGLLQSSAISLYVTIIFILVIEKRLRVVSMRTNYKVQQKEMLQYSIPLVPSALAWWIMNASDRYVIKWALGSATNGIYSIAYKFPSILQMVFSMFNNAWTDMALAQLNNGEKTKEYIKQIFQQLYKFSFSLMFVLIPLSKLVMQYILNTDYKEASVYIGFLYLGAVFQGFSTFCSVGYLQEKKTKSAAKTSIMGACINLIVNIVCIRYIGLFAASISTFLGFFVMWILRMNDVKDYFPVTIDKKVFGVYTLVGIALALVIIWTNSIWDVCLTLIAGVFAIVSNRKLITSMLKGIINKL